LVNPYEISGQGKTPQRRRRGVRRYAALAMLLTSVALTLTIPGCFLLTQNLRIFPGSPTADGFVVNNTPISTSVITAYLFGFGAVFLVASAGFAFLAFSNVRKNANSHLASTQDGG